uniref:calcium-binding protein n=1 Tax=Cupriavidus yeoncheonensis TaxID=1462994 RepID=UPI003F49791C
MWGSAWSLPGRVTPPRYHYCNSGSVRWGEREVVAPLAQIAPLNGDKATRVAVADWHYWRDQGCVL